jgi:hypothetical protein
MAKRFMPDLALRFSEDGVVKLAEQVKRGIAVCCQPSQAVGVHNSLACLFLSVVNVRMGAYYSVGSYARHPAPKADALPGYPELSALPVTGKDYGLSDPAVQRSQWRNLEY